jgi:hypothetical protein
VSSPERITSPVLSLHNIAAEAVHDGHGLNLQRPVSSDIRQGTAQLSKDRAEGHDSFKEGLVWGSERKSEWPESLNEPLGRLWAYGMQVDMARRTHWQRNQSVTDETVAREYAELQQSAPQIEALMLEVARNVRMFGGVRSSSRWHAGASALIVSFRLPRQQHSAMCFRSTC